jgi:DNA mismatch endonuclease (patch repair protein)
MDTLPKEKRSWVMSRVKSKNTKPELVFRKLIHHAGFRYRLHDKTLPGKPDLVLRKYRTVVFVHGCFWHKHENCTRSNLTPSDNAKYWATKQAGNAARDVENVWKLEQTGWRVFIVWECELKKLEASLDRFKRFIKSF